MTDTAAEARLFLADHEALDLELDGCVVSVRTLMSPDRDSGNEDAAALIPVGDNALVIGVADGVGGSPGGCVASQAIVEALRDSAAPAESGESVRDVVLDAIERANAVILESGTRSASTAVVAAISGSQLRGYHVGDSELFVVGQRGRMKHRIVPHSPTAFAVEAGLLDESEAMHHDQRHIIFNVVGTPSMHVDVSAPVELAPLDTVLLCSDGVTDNLFVSEIVELIRKGPLAAAADRLLAAARERMLDGIEGQPSKPDDVTIVLFRQRRPRRKR